MPSDSEIQTPPNQDTQPLSVVCTDPRRTKRIHLSEIFPEQGVRTFVRHTAIQLDDIYISGIHLADGRQAYIIVTPDFFNDKKNTGNTQAVR